MRTRLRPSSPGRRPAAGSRRLLALLLGLFVAATGCATSEGERPREVGPEILPERVIPTGANAVYSHDGLVLVPIPQSPGAILYVKSPRPHLQRYEKMMLAATTLTYHEGTAGWSRRQEDQMLGGFESDLLDELKDGEFWERSDSVGEDTLILKATVAELDLEAGSPQQDTSSATTFVEASGGAVLGFEIFDSMTQEPLMRFVQRRKLPGGVYAGGQVEEQRLRLVFRSFARDLGDVLQAHYRVVQEIERRESEAAPQG